jgi:predicted ATPase
MERIVIKDFGPIKNLEINDIKKITIFIGDSGSGKSTVMKVISLFRWLYKMLNIRSFLKYSGVKKSPFRFGFVNLLKNNGILGYLKPTTVLIYQNGSLTLEWDSKTKKLKGTSSYIPKEELSLEKISYISDKRNLISNIVDNNLSIKRDMFYINETYSDFETAVREVNEIELLNLGIKFSVRKTPQGLKYVIIPNDGSNDYSIKLNEASSGTQNVVPVNVIVEYYSKYYDLVSSINNAIFSYVSKSDNLSDFKAVKNVGEFSSKNVHLIIEEPELSLFPSTQRELIDFIVSNITHDPARGYNISLMMATHSPYIINYLNVLLRRSSKGIDEVPSIKASDLAVYRVYEGQIQDLMSQSIATGETIVNTMDLSEDMEDIYNEYISLK